MYRAAIPGQFCPNLCFQVPFQITWPTNRDYVRSFTNKNIVFLHAKNYDPPPQFSSSLDS
jgi:hypothetical protein